MSDNHKISATRDASGDACEGVRYEGITLHGRPNGEQGSNKRELIIDILDDGTVDIWVIDKNTNTADGLLVQVGDSPEDGFATWYPKSYKL